MLKNSWPDKKKSDDFEALNIPLHVFCFQVSFNPFKKILMFYKIKFTAAITSKSLKTSISNSLQILDSRNRLRNIW